MQERRTTIRYECSARAQYCPEVDFTPRDGRLTTLSERGLGLLAREPRQPGERLTVSFTLPGEDEAVTMTGIVRWANGATPRTRWYPLGLEWLPLEETTRFRLETFLRNHSAAVSPHTSTGSTPWGTWWSLRRVQWSTVALLSMGTAVVLLASIFLLQQENTQLADAVHRRNLGMLELRQAEASVRRALEMTTGRLAEASSAVAILERESGEVQGEMDRLTQEVEQFQAAYATLRERHEGLTRQIMDLEQARARMVRGASPTPLLRQAIRGQTDPP